jgi:hypothetical protein
VLPDTTGLVRENVPETPDSCGTDTDQMARPVCASTFQKVPPQSGK